MGLVLAMALVTVGDLVMIRFKSDFHRVGLQVLGAAIAFVGALILPFVTTPLAVLFTLMVAVVLMFVTTQYVLARRLRKARASMPPTAPRPPRVADPSAPPTPPFEPTIIDLIDRADSVPPLQGQGVLAPDSEFTRAWSTYMRPASRGSGTPVLFL